MNNLLQKCVDELAKQEPDLSFIKGILTTVIEMNPEVKSYIPSVGSNLATVSGISTKIVPDIEKELSPAEQAVQGAIGLATGNVKPTHTGIRETNVVLNG